MSIIDNAKRWLDQDPDAVTRAELTELLAKAGAGEPEAIADLHDRFRTRLGFGTAGLRGELGAGPNRMNRVVVQQTALAIARFLTGRPTASGDVPHVVIGFDGRVNSDVFAADSAAVLAANGVTVSVLPRMLPTPVLAFAVRALAADAGIMVTASHNPPRDNGYKVYLGGADGGSQLVSPADAEIAALIDEVAAAPLAPLVEGIEWETLDEGLVDDYAAVTASVALTRVDAEALGAPLSWVYTAMHGVGGRTFASVLGAAGIPAPVPVAEQLQPDGEFPTVSFPNPEEPGALDLAVATARSVGAELIIAHDPDADRLAVALPNPDAAGGWERLSGNEVGGLLAWWVAEGVAEADRPRLALAESLVSSPALGAVARAYGMRHAETLTGFKWISRTPDLAFGYEEALGYLVNPDDVRDKDGISAAVAFLALVQSLRAEGVSIAEHRAAFDARFGVYRSGQVSLRFPQVAEATAAVQALAADPPSEWAGVDIERLDDFSAGFDGLPPQDLLRFLLVDGSRILVRPSGTEPKLKVYLDVRADDAASAAERLAALDAAVRARLVG